MSLNTPLLLLLLGCHGPQAKYGFLVTERAHTMWLLDLSWRVDGGLCWDGCDKHCPCTAQSHLHWCVQRDMLQTD